MTGFGSKFLGNVTDQFIFIYVWFLSFLSSSGRPIRIPGQRDCKPHSLTRDEWDRIRAGGNPTTGLGEGYTMAHHETTVGRIVATVYPAIKDPAFIRRIKNKQAWQYFTRAFMAQEISWRASPAWAEALTTPHSGRSATSMDLDNPYKEKYRNEHFENTVFRTLLGIPMKNAGDDLHYRPADNYATRLQRCPWGRQVPPDWTVENDDYEDEEDTGPPQLEENWDDDSAPQQQPRDNPTLRDHSAPLDRSNAWGEAREPRQGVSSRQREHQPRGNRRDRGKDRRSSRRDKSSRGDQPWSRGCDQGQPDRESSDHHEHRGCHASQNRDRHARREPSHGRNHHSHREPSQGRARQPRQESSQGRDRRSRRSGTQEELDHIRREYTRTRSQRRREQRSRSAMQGHPAKRPATRADEGTDPGPERLAP